METPCRRDKIVNGTTTKRQAERQGAFSGAGRAVRSVPGGARAKKNRKTRRRGKSGRFLLTSVSAFFIIIKAIFESGVLWGVGALFL